MCIRFDLVKMQVSMMFVSRVICLVSPQISNFLIGVQVSAFYKIFKPNIYCQIIDVSPYGQFCNAKDSYILSTQNNSVFAYVVGICGLNDDVKLTKF